MIGVAPSGRPPPGDPPDTGRAGPVDGGFHESEDRTLQRGGSQDLAPASVFVGGVRRLVVTRDVFPDLFEHQTGHGTGGRAEYQPDRLVRDPSRQVAHDGRRLARWTTTAVAMPTAIAVAVNGLRTTAGTWTSPADSRTLATVTRASSATVVDMVMA